MTRLKELLNPDEIVRIPTTISGKIFNELTIKDIDEIAIIIISGEFESMPEGSIIATAINILTDRAISRKLDLF